MRGPLNFRKHTAARLFNYLFLIPFILGYRPLLIRFERSEFIWYTIGTAVIFMIIVFSNSRPYLKMDDRKLTLYLHYYQTPEVHSLDRITLVEPLGKHSCRVHSRDFKPVRINLNPGDMTLLLKTFSERNIKIRQI